MERPISVGTSIHAAPQHAAAWMTKDAPLILTFGVGAYPSVTMFCMDPVLSQDLAAAINGVLERHRLADKAEAA